MVPGVKGNVKTKRVTISTESLDINSIILLIDSVWEMIFYYQAFLHYLPFNN